jgi:UDP-N-acetylglucosamine/UDP-N-acetylgalactosamine 4-epimerase
MYETAYHQGSLENSTFLVTGGAGFIGSHLVEYLLQWKARKIIILDNLATGFAENIEPFLKAPNIEWMNGDITVEDDCNRAMKGVDYVLHQAALGSVPRSVENPIATNKTNIDGFLNILVAAKNEKVKRVVYASSSSVYGDSKILPKKEEQIGKPLSPYAVTKLVNEQYADVFVKTYGMEIIGLRYFNIFGPRQNPSGAYAAAIPLFMNALLSGKDAYINGDGGQTRDFTFVANAVQANIKATFAPFNKNIDQVYNVAVSDRVSIKELYQTLMKLTGSTIPPVHREERAGDIRDSLADISKAANELNYQPEVKVQDGLSITLDWFKKAFFS